MRYTTVIDISENRRLYQSAPVRLVYLHLCLRAGYEDENRDLVKDSIRAIAADAGVTISAARHALQVLERHGYVKRSDGCTMVRHWLPAKNITPRGSSGGTKGDILANVYTKPEAPQSDDQWRTDRIKTLTNAVESVRKNPRSMLRGLLETAYKTGELEQYGIDWKPKNTK